VKVRITLLHEDDVSSDVLDGTKEEKGEMIKATWELVLGHFQKIQNDPSVRMLVESVEVLE